jgi:hypothetical protein
VFADLTNTRTRARQKKNDVSGTGGGSAKVKSLTHIEERILNILSTVVIDGAPNVPEPGLNISGDRANLVGDIEAEICDDNEGIQRYINNRTRTNNNGCTRGTETKKRKLLQVSSFNPVDLIKSQEALASSMQSLAEAISDWAEAIRYAADKF